MPTFESDVAAPLKSAASINRSSDQPKKRAVVGGQRVNNHAGGCSENARKISEGINNRVDRRVRSNLPGPVVQRANQKNRRAAKRRIAQVGISSAGELGYEIPRGDDLPGH